MTDFHFVRLVFCAFFSTYDWLPLREASFLCRPPATTFLAILKPRVSHEVSSQGAFRQGLIASLMGDLLTTFITIHGLESDWFTFIKAWFFQLWHYLLKFRLNAIVDIEYGAYISLNVIVSVDFHQMCPILNVIWNVDCDAGFHMTSLNFKLQNYWSSWNVTFMMNKSC